MHRLVVIGRHTAVTTGPILTLTLTLTLTPVSLYSVLFLSVAVSTIERQCSREAAFFHA